MFDRARLKLRPLEERKHDMSAADCLTLDSRGLAFSHPDLPLLAGRIRDARARSRPVVVMMGAHVIKQGLSRHVIDLMERGLITHVAMNGACIIHEYELARFGATTESVARYVSEGQFGLWRETGQINDWVAEGVYEELGLGMIVGRMLSEGDNPHSDLSILAAGFRLGIPVTVHVSLGYDIIHEHPNFDPGATGIASYRDFLVLVEGITHLEGGVLLNIGTAVMGPEVYLKALSMARNVAHQEGREIRHFTTAVFDLQEIAGDFRQEAGKANASYYFRPHKTILVRTVADGGESFYFCGDHCATIPALRSAILHEVNATASAV